MSGCLVCDGPLPAGKPDWCSRRCRKALRSLGIALAPTAPRVDQLAAALAHRRSAAALGIAMPATFRQVPSTTRDR